jgi:chorismate mutase
MKPGGNQDIAQLFSPETSPGQGVNELRKKVDVADAIFMMFLDAWSKIRDDLTQSIGREKIANGIGITDPEREATKLEQVLFLCEEFGQDPEVIIPLFKSKIRESSENQEALKDQPGVS